MNPRLADRAVAVSSEMQRAHVWLAGAAPEEPQRGWQAKKEGGEDEEEGDAGGSRVGIYAIEEAKMLCARGNSPEVSLCLRNFENLRSKQSMCSLEHQTKRSKASAPEMIRTKASKADTSAMMSASPSSRY